MSADQEVDELCIAVGDLVVKVSKAKAAPTSGYSGASSRSSAVSDPPRESGALAGPSGPLAPAPAGAGAPSEAGSWRVVGTEEPEPGVPWSWAWETELLAASSPDEVLAVDLEPVDHLGARISSTSAGWSPRARLGRALRAGLIARRLLDGLSVRPANIGGPTLPTRFYIILRAAPGRLAGWTEDYILYRDQVIHRDGNFHSGTVSQAFASRAEAEAYLLGAREPWPPALQRRC